MKILLTGCTRLQTTRVDTSENYYSIFNGYHRALVKAGHDVDWRAVTPGEELHTRYDAAFIGLHGFGAMVCTTNKAGALWAAHELPHCVLFEDWRVKTIFAHLRNSGYFWNHLLSGNDKAFAAALGVKKQIERVRYSWERKLPCTVMPMMEWGTVDAPLKLHEFDNLTLWNLDPMYREHLEERHGAFWNTTNLPQKHEWSLLSACSDASMWLHKLQENCGKLQWPVFGKWRPKEQRTKGGGQSQSREELGFIPEDDLIRGIYAEMRGMMMMGYGKETLPGWWRNRYQLAARCGAILVTDSDGLNPLTYFVDPTAIEKMDDYSLDEASLLQRATLDEITPNSNASVAAFNAVTELLTPAWRR